MNDKQLTLRDLALMASDRHGGARGRALGRIAEKQGLKLVYTTVDKLIAGTYLSKPTRQTIEALAALADVPVEVAYKAADVPMPLAKLAEQLPPDADTLDSAQRDAVLSVVRQFAVANAALHDARKDVMGNAEHPAPTSSLLDSATGSGGFLAAEIDEAAVRRAAAMLGGISLAELFVLALGDDTPAAADLVAASRDLGGLDGDDLSAFFSHDHVEEAVSALRARRGLRERQDNWEEQQQLAARTVPTGSAGQRRRAMQDAASEGSQDPADHRAALSKSLRKRARDQARDDASTP